MPLFQAKIGCKLSFRFFPTRREIENPKKITKKFKNLKDTIMPHYKPK